MPLEGPLAPDAHSFLTTSGATLTYVVAGQGRQVLVNVAPGWGCASPLYQNSFSFLEDDFTFVHLDPRGSRGSSFPEDMSQMSSWHMSEDVESLRVHLGHDLLDTVMGHSNGACIALWYAIRFPERLQKLVLLDAQLPGSEAVVGPAMVALLETRPERDAVEAFMNFNPFKLESDEAFGKVLDSFLVLYLAHPDRGLDRVRAALTNTPQLACVKAQAPAEGQHSDQADQLGAVAAKTLIVVGRVDFICPVPVSEMLGTGIKGSVLEILEDSGHFPWVEEGAKFRDILKQFCAGM